MTEAINNLSKQVICVISRVLVYYVVALEQSMVLVCLFTKFYTKFNNLKLGLC